MTTPTYHGYITLQGEDKLLRFVMDAETGNLQRQTALSLAGGPAPLSVNPGQDTLYVGLRASNEIAAFRIDHDTGELSALGRVALDADPCYLTTDRNGRFLLAAYYGAGQVTIHPINDDGSVSGSVRQVVVTAEHAHCIELDRTNSFAFVPHTVPPNVIYQFQFDGSQGQLAPNPVPQLIASDGAGPRHYVFHPDKDLVYTSNENGSSVTAYHLDTTTGTLSPFQTLSTLPDDFSGANTCAQIHIHPTGRFLYVSNRGHNSIAYFAVDSASGQLSPLGQQRTEPVPRVFNLDPTGQFLFAAGQESGWLAGYRIDPELGTLVLLDRYQLGHQPMWVMIFSLK